MVLTGWSKLILAIAGWNRWLKLEICNFSHSRKPFAKPSWNCNNKIQNGTENELCSKYSDWVIINFVCTGGSRESQSGYAPSIGVMIGKKLTPFYFFYEQFIIFYYHRARSGSEVSLRFRENIWVWAARPNPTRPGDAFSSLYLCNQLAVWQAVFFAG